MDMSFTTALSGIIGTTIGFSASVAIAWVNQRTHQRRELARDRFQRTEGLYSDFIDACSRMLIDALQHQLEKTETLLPAYALLNRIRLTASNEVLSAAEHLLRQIAERYFSPNLSISEVRELARSTAGDPLRAFGEACRRELVALQAQL